jgi:hypothetical protein
MRSRVRGCMMASRVHNVQQEAYVVVKIWIFWWAQVESNVRVLRMRPSRERGMMAMGNPPFFVLLQYYILYIEWIWVEWSVGVGGGSLMSTVLEVGGETQTVRSLLMAANCASMLLKSTSSVLRVTASDTPNFFLSIRELVSRCRFNNSQGRFHDEEKVLHRVLTWSAG